MSTSISDNNEFTYLKITEVKKGKTSSGLDIWTCTYEEKSLIEKDDKTIEEITTGKKGTRRYFGKEKDLPSVKHSYEGQISEYKTTPYSKDRNKTILQTITVVVLHQENGLEIAAKELAKYQAYPYDENGNIYRLKDKSLGNEGVEQ